MNRHYDLSKEAIARLQKNSPKLAQAVRALFDDFEAMRKDNDELYHDLGMYMEIASKEAQENEELREELARMKEAEQNALWENRELGADEAYVRVAKDVNEKAIDDAIAEAYDMMADRRCDAPSSEWLPAPGHMPSDLAEAQILGTRFSHEGGGITGANLADRVPWGEYGLEYRPLLSDSGLPLCSSEGLHPGTRYVAANESGVTWQFNTKPWVASTDYSWEPPGAVLDRSPETHRKPGPWQDSLMEVMR